MMVAADKVSSPRTDAPDGSTVWWTIAAALALLAFRPYQGIVHDARLYVGYALAALHPDTIGHDVLFMFDGQSGRSVYPWLLRGLVSAAGPARAAHAAVLMGLAVWFVGYRQFVAAIAGETGRGWRLPALMAAGIALPAIYGPLSIFSIAEPFATPRGVAEGGCLLALGLLLNGRYLWAGASLLVALAMHPIMTAPAIGVALLYASYDAVVVRTMRLTPRAFGCALLALFTIGVLLSLALPRFDAAWRGVLANRHALVFPRYWPAEDYARMLLHVVSVSMATSLLAPAVRRLAVCALVVAGGGVLLTWVAGDLVGVRLIAQGQAWRALWIVLTLAQLSMLLLLLASIRTAVDADRPWVADLRRAAVALLAAAWIVQEVNIRAALLVLLAALCWWGPTRWSLKLPPGGWRWVVGAAAIVVVGAVGVMSWVSVQVARTAPDPALRASGAYIVATGLPTLAVVALSVAALTDRMRWTSLRSLLCLASLAVIGGRSFDGRTSYQKYLETALDARARGEPAPVPAGGAVAWYYGDLEAWAFAGQPGWGSVNQGIPLVFDRRLAMLWSTRSRRLSDAGFLPRAEAGATLLAPATIHLDERDVKLLCTQPDAPALLVLPADAIIESASAGRAVTSFVARVPKLLRPDSIGMPWRTMSGFSVWNCAR